MRRIVRIKPILGQYEGFRGILYQFYGASDVNRKLVHVNKSTNYRLDQGMLVYNFDRKYSLRLDELIDLISSAERCIRLTIKDQMGLLAKIALVYINLETENIVLDDYWFDQENIWIVFDENEGSHILPLKRADLSKYKVYLIGLQSKKEQNQIKKIKQKKEPQEESQGKAILKLMVKYLHLDKDEESNQTSALLGRIRSELSNCLNAKGNTWLVDLFNKINDFVNEIDGMQINLINETFSEKAENQEVLISGIMNLTKNTVSNQIDFEMVQCQLAQLQQENYAWSLLRSKQKERQGVKGYVTSLIPWKQSQNGDDQAKDTIMNYVKKLKPNDSVSIEPSQFAAKIINAINENYKMQLVIPDNFINKSLIKLEISMVLLQCNTQKAVQELCQIINQGNPEEQIDFSGKIEYKILCEGIKQSVIHEFRQQFIAATVELVNSLI